MHTTKTIAIIGMGETGKAIATALAKGSDRLLLFDKDIDEVKIFVTQLQQPNNNAGIEAIECTYDAAWEADIIFLAVPFDARLEIAKYIKEVATQKIVVPLPYSYKENIDSKIELASAEELQQALPYCKVATASYFDKHIECCLKGNDEDAIQTIKELFNTINRNFITG
jgi:predicted dinucleotide-binding enzyme